jgi:thiol:disulfide interchange protein DsbA
VVEEAAGDVVLRRVPVWFQDVPFRAQQRLFYTLETLGLRRACTARCSPRSTTSARACAPPEDIAAFALKNGSRSDPLHDDLRVARGGRRCQQARQLAEAYKIDAVPAMGVHGRYYTNGNLANSGQPAKGPDGRQRTAARGRRRTAGRASARTQAL